jgi:phage terminase large subunit
VQQTIDLGYRARPPFVQFHKRQERFACMVCHRGAGKTVATINDLLDAALRKDGSRYAYVGPTYKQAKAVAWDYLGTSCRKLLSLGAKSNESELRWDLPNGGQVRLYGADNFEALRGLHLDGVALDEFADFDPRAWPTVIRPALNQKEGSAVFIGTPKGRNEFFKIWERSRTEPGWFSLMLKASESGLVKQSEIDSQRRDLTDDQYEQEFECSFDAAIKGAYYGKLMAAAESAKRITGVPYDPAARVWTSWDLGFRDATVVWFAQVIGKEIHLIDYHESVGADITDDVKAVQAKPYNYAGHIVPHDAYAHEKQTGKTTAQFMEGLGLRDLQRAPDHRVQDGITNVQVLLPKCWFDALKCERGIDALKQYRAEFDNKLETLKPKPVHDWTSHAADSFRYLAMTLDGVARSGFDRPINYPSMAVA